MNLDPNALMIASLSVLVFSMGAALVSLGRALHAATKLNRACEMYIAGLENEIAAKDAVLAADEKTMNLLREENRALHEVVDAQKDVIGLLSRGEVSHG